MPVCGAGLRTDRIFASQEQSASTKVFKLGSAVPAAPAERAAKTDSARTIGSKIDDRDSASPPSVRSIGFWKRSAQSYSIDFAAK